MAKVLMLCSDLCYEQFTKGEEDPGYNGDISQLPSYSKLPGGYTQIGSLKAPEMDFTKGSDFVEKICRNNKFDVTNDKDLKSLDVGKEVYFGFLLKANISDGNNVIAFRGTQTVQEWLLDFTGVQVPVPLGWFGNKYDFKVAKVHLGFLIQYAFLFEQVLDGAKQFDKDLCVNVTGHSLGAALAVLGATAVRILNYPIEGFLGNVHMYNFAGSRVGNQAFADAYNFLVSNSYRIVNMADIVPVVPPSSLKLGQLDLEYIHVGKEFSYLWQKGDVAPNHSSTNNYTPAVYDEVPTDVPMKDGPVTGRC
jgi:predicted lipase